MKEGGLKETCTAASSTQIAEKWGPLAMMKNGMEYG